MWLWKILNVDTKGETNEDMEYERSGVQRRQERNEKRITERKKRGKMNKEWGYKEKNKNGEKRKRERREMITRGENRGGEERRELGRKKLE